MRFHLDENVPFAVAAGLRRRAIDATCAAEVELLGARDETHLSFALRSGRMLVTHDRDFLRLHHNGVPHAGIAYCRQGSLTIGEMLHRLVLIHDLLGAEEIRGRIEYL